MLNARIQFQLSFLLLIALGGTTRGEEIDLVIVAGQSNAVGFDAKPGELPASDADMSTLFWWRCGDPPPDRHDSNCGGKWTHLQPQSLGQPNKDGGLPRQYGNFAQSEGGFGPEIGLARALPKTNRRLAVMKVAFSGTGLDRDWRPNDDGPNGFCFRALQAELQLGFDAAAQQGIEFRPRGFFWVQGESDANATDAPQYADRIGKMLDALRADLKAPALPCFLAVNTRFQEGKNKFMPTIVAQQRRAAARDPNCYYVDSSSATIANGVHYDAQGTLAVGRWFAESLVRHEADRTHATPQIRIVALGDSITKGVRTGVSANQTFASLLESHLNRAGRRTKVVNVGIGGERTDQALKRFDKVLALDPDYVLIMYGTNDSYIDQGKTASRLTLSNYEANLKSIVVQLLQRGITPVLMTEPRWAIDARPNGVGDNPNIRLEPYVDSCRKVAKEWRVPLVDNFARWSEAESKGAKLRDWTTDGCHPNPTGHEQIAQLALPVLQSALPRQLKARAALTNRKPLRVVCFGDSVTGVYYHTGSRRAYADMLQIALERFAPGSGVEVVNAGVSGNTTVNALARMERDVISKKPDVVTIMFGLNDMTRVNLGDYRDNLVKIVNRCRDAGAEVVLATPNNVIDTASRPTSKLIQYCDVVRELSVQLKAPLCDAYQEMEARRAAAALDWRLLMSDAIHPNMDGHKLIASKLAAAISGSRISLDDVGPSTPLLRHSLAKSPEVQLKVLAAFPGAAGNGITPWNIANLGIAQLREAAKARVRATKPDLVLIAIPRSAYQDVGAEFVDHHIWIANWSLNFGAPTWDVVMIHPDVFEPSNEDAERDKLIRRLVRAQDLPLIDRPLGNTDDGADIVNRWMKNQLKTWQDN